MAAWFGLIWCFYLVHTSSSSLEYLRSLTPAQVANLTKSQFVYGYDAYKQYAWGCDALYPQTKACHNYYDYSLMWTPIDALDTMILMGLTEQVNETIDLLCSTPFNNEPKFTFLTNQDVFVFDYFLRSLGGLLSAYHLTNNSCLFDLAKQVSDAIYPIFNEITPSLSGLPWTHMNLATGKVDTSQSSTSPAVAGTHTLEYGIMSVLTKDLKYWNASMNAMRILYEAKSDTLGLVGNQIFINQTSDIHSREFWLGTESFIDSGIDSYYEYIVKCWGLFNNTECKQWWIDGGINASIIEHLSYYNKNPNNNQQDLLWFKRVDMYSGKNEGDWNNYDLYAAFYSGVLSLSTTLLSDDAMDKKQATLRLAKLNQDANWFMWNLSFIEPYVFDFQHFDNLVNSYNLNPENFESNYYLYQITNDSLYYDRALMYLDDLMTYCKCDGIYNASGTNCVGYSGLTNVVLKLHSNSQPSYWFGESLKYLYLTFMRNEANNPLPFDDYIFNTEAHPFPKVWGYKLQEMLH